MLKAGDTLTILPGEYQEAVEARKLAGTKAAPITIRAQRSGTVLLRGDVEVAGWERELFAEDLRQPRLTTTCRLAAGHPHRFAGLGEGTGRHRMLVGGRAGKANIDFAAPRFDLKTV